ncbi:MAG: LysM peptidoglycan-binding domain-containing protein [Anaerolineae bacterium]|nr:LysM peptidoglycan-binding domain-containing protein [Anaerolineae bacterium]
MINTKIRSGMKTFISRRGVYFVLIGVLLSTMAASCRPTTQTFTVTLTSEPRVEAVIAVTFTPRSQETPLVPAGRVAPATEQPAFPSPTSTLSGALVSTPESFSQYTVAAGDAMINLAQRFDIPMAAIQLANDLGGETGLRAGQVLNIPDPSRWQGASPYWIVYEVQPGETLSEIAKAHDLTLAEVIDTNDLTEADFIHAGQSLILPLEGPAQLVAAAQNPLPEPETATPTPVLTSLASLSVTLSLSPTAETLAAAVEDTPDPTATGTPMPTPQTAPALTGDTSALRSEIFRLLNEQRALFSLPPLEWNDVLASAAQKHADDCYARGWCGHTGSDGSTMKTRIIREGYDPVRWSECWAWYATPELAVAMWMDEVPPNDPHRKTILSSYLMEVGVGVVPANNGRGFYFIADFGTPR